MAEHNKDLQQVRLMLIKAVGPIFAVGLIAGGCHIINEKVGLENDNPIEEIAEYALEEYLDLPPDSLDFTPNE